jgi:hypothetical protein
MKKVFLTLFTYLILSTMYAQTKTDLYGSWQMDFKNADRSILTLTTSDVVDLLHATGLLIEFKSDGTYTETGDPLGEMQDNNYHYTGKWKYNAQSKTIELTEIKVLKKRPNIRRNYKVLTSGQIQIVSSENYEFVVKITKAWEVVSSKK